LPGDETKQGNNPAKGKTRTAEGGCKTGVRKGVKLFDPLGGSAGQMWKRNEEKKHKLGLENLREKKKLCRETGGKNCVIRNSKSFNKKGGQRKLITKGPEAATSKRKQ